MGLPPWEDPESDMGPAMRELLARPQLPKCSCVQCVPSGQHVRGWRCMLIEARRQARNKDLIAAGVITPEPPYMPPVEIPMRAARSMTTAEKRAVWSYVKAHDPALQAALQDPFTKSLIAEFDASPLFDARLVENALSAPLAA